jgi:hypothetical protein
MKRDKKILAVGDLVRSYVRRMGKEDEFLRASIKNHWEDIVGKAIAGYTKNIYFNNNILFIKIESAALKHQMIILKEDIRNKINYFISKDLIVDIVFI